MELSFRGEVIYWRGPAPFHFVEVPSPQREELARVAPSLTYGWGCVPANVTINETTYYTALFPKNGGYLVPVKVAVRRAEGLDVGDEVDMTVELGR